MRRRLLCKKDGKWKEKLYKSLDISEEVTLYAIGDNRYDLLGFVYQHTDLEIVDWDIHPMKKREKGLGLEMTVRRYPP